MNENDNPLARLAEPVRTDGWADSDRLRRAAGQRRRRRAGLAGAVAAVCAIAVIVPLLTRGPSSAPVYRGPLAVGERQGAAYQLLGDTTSSTTAGVDVSTTEQAFSLRLIRQQLATSGNRNVVLSPISLSIALTMLNLGARGETSTQIARLLAPSGSSAQSIAAGYRDLMADMIAAAAKSKIKLESANSIWQQEGFPLGQDFVNDLTAYLRSGVWQVDFTAHPDRAADAINAWVSDRTHGKIPKLVDADEISDWVLAIVNAVYFKAAWLEPFGRSGEESFSASGGSVSVPSVTGGGGAVAHVTGDYTAVQIPYVGGRFAATIVEPKAGSLSDFLRSFDAAAYRSVITGLRSDGEAAALTMPQLHLKTDSDLKPTLQGLGVRDAFSDGADLSRLSPESTFVAEVKQLATLDLDKKGTEAAAATVIGAAASSAQIMRPVVIDRPYLFLIRDTVSGAILFTAAVQDPSTS